MSALVLFPLTEAALARLRLRGVLRSREIAEREEWRDFDAMHAADEQYERMDRIGKGLTP